MTLHRGCKKIPEDQPKKSEMLLLYRDSLKDKVIIKEVIIGDQCIRFSGKEKNVE